MPTVTPFLWFEDNLQEALDFYAGIFPDAIVGSAQTNSEDLFSATFEPGGQRLKAFNAGPGHPFTDAISLFIDCADQAEVDHYWDALIADGGGPVQCGWLTDRFGLSWQVVPRRLGELLGDPDPNRAQRAMQAMLQMVKLDVAALERAADGA